DLFRRSLMVSGARQCAAGIYHKRPKSPLSEHKTMLMTWLLVDLDQLMIWLLIDLDQQFCCIAG
ncbi:hypothetical protein, partial [Rhodanobacter thiooxydans]|uniref:hypothetical protein n=1 Tax=Rhodanobacter thiooxydans TaxID=416169 RepID=UPI001EE6751D